METITDKMKQAGSDIAMHLTDACIRRTCAGLGGCPNLDMQDFPAEYHDLIQAYLDDEIDSVSAIFIAMTRAKGDQI